MDAQQKNTLKTFRQKTGKRKILFIVLGILVIFVIAFVSNLKKQAATLEETITSLQQTDTATRRSLVKSIGATGKIVSTTQKDITSSLTGTDISSIAVNIGDSVSAGDLLLSFDTTRIEENLSTAKNTLSKAESRNELSESDAKRNYDTQMENAKEALDDAKEYYAAVLDYLAVLDKELDNMTDEMERQQQQQKIERYEAKLEPAKEAYEAQLKNYERTVANATSSLNSTLLNLDTASQKAQVELYEKQLQNADLYAPISGIVTALNYEVGDTYGGGTLITLQDCSAFEVEAQISEYDISDIVLGQKVLIKTNATGEEEMSGTIHFISPTATSTNMSSSDVTYNVRIRIANPSDRLRLDMSASLSIILEEHENVLTVPYNAIQLAEDGSSFVSVKAEDGSFANVAVTVIMESNYYTEITSEELTEGMEVLIIDSGSNGLFDLLNVGRRGGF